MTFDAREIAQEADTEFLPWDFVDLDGNPQAIPHPYMLTANQSLKLVEADRDQNDHAVFEVLDDVAPEASQALRVMPGIVVGRLLEAWRKEIGELGKSDLPPLTANRATRRSKQTSKSGAKTSARSASTR